MKNTGHTECIQKGIFLLIGSGESYNTKIVRGANLLEEILEMTCGSPKDASQEEREGWADQLDDPDYWQQNIDLGPVAFEESVGETDRIQIFLLEGLKDLPVVN